MKGKSKFLLLVVGALIGVAGAVGYNVSMDMTSTDEFCLGCHNHKIPYDELKKSAHFNNASGVTAGCADCHLPYEFGPKLMRKIAASKEVWGHLTGIIDTDEKYLEHRDAMKQRELARMRASDSAECRSCHNPERMNHEEQSRAARKAHLKKSEGKTCIDCHDGIVHTPEAKEDDFDF